MIGSLIGTLHCEEYRLQCKQMGELSIKVRINEAEAAESACLKSRFALIYCCMPLCSSALLLSLLFHN